MCMLATMWLQKVKSMDFERCAASPERFSGVLRSLLFVCAHSLLPGDCNLACANTAEMLESEGLVVMQLTAPPPQDRLVVVGMQDSMAASCKILRNRLAVTPCFLPHLANGSSARHVPQHPLRVVRRPGSHCHEYADCLQGRTQNVVHQVHGWWPC